MPLVLPAQPLARSTYGENQGTNLTKKSPGKTQVSKFRLVSTCCPPFLGSCPYTTDGITQGQGKEISNMKTQFTVGHAFLIHH